MKINQSAVAVFDEKPYQDEGLELEKQTGWCGTAQGIGELNSRC